MSRDKVAAAMRTYRDGRHTATDRKQAVAAALSQARKKSSESSPFKIARGK